MPQSLINYQIDYSLKREINELYLSSAIRKFGLGMITLFEPIYFYLYFGSIQKTLVYLIIQYVLYFFLAPLGGKIFSKIGLKRSILISMPILCLYYLGLYNIGLGLGMVVAIGLLNLLFKLFFWPAFHTDFAKFSKREIRGRQTSRLTLITTMVEVLGPLLGGLIIVKFGYPVLFIIIMILLIASTFPLFMSPEIYETYSFTYKQAISRVFTKSRLRRTLAFAAQGAESKVAIWIWPLFLYMLFADFAKIGYLTSGILFITAVLIIFLGKQLDKGKKSLILRIGSILNSSGWLFKLFVTSLPQVFIVDAYSRFAQRSLNIPFLTIFYDKAAKRGSYLDEYIIFREMSHSLGAVVMFSLTLWIFSVTGELVWAFIIAAAGSLALINYSK
ncbi:MFS transporter [Patescibacteria group bacterium]|nr:MFS transporter [Patescibacteria group bacterium]